MPSPNFIARYEIIRRIAEGGMASVYLARDPALDRQVAIKVLRADFDEETARERFLREARSAGSLRHANIVTIFDIGEQDGYLYIAMEYVEGETLGQLVRRKAPLMLTRKLELADALCSGLAYAHESGLIHRDIKPSNLMVDQSGTLKILDFGIARPEASNMTTAGLVIGSLNYMAPEQMMGRPVDSRADIFSAGAVLYELLSYKQAFPGDLSSGVLQRVLTGSPEPLESSIPGLNPALAEIINRCLAKDPGDRYSDLLQVRRALASVRQADEHAGLNKETAADVGMPGAVLRSIGSAQPDRSAQLLADATVLLEMETPGAAAAAREPVPPAPAAPALTPSGKSVSVAGTDAGPSGDLIVPLAADFRFEHIPLDAGDEQRLVGRRSDLEKLLQRILHGRGGAFLVAGYRGVGKTSFVNLLIGGLDRAYEQNGRTGDLVVVRLTLAKRVRLSILLHLLLRGLNDELKRTGVFDVLDETLQQRISDSVELTLYNVKRDASDKVSAELGFGDAMVAAPIIGKLSLKQNRERARSKELVAKAYDDPKAEQDLLQIAEQLNAGYTPRLPLWRRAAASFRRRVQPRRSVRVLFVLDELDKQEEEWNQGETGTGTPLDRVLASVKNVVASKWLTFIFVAGVDLYEKALEDKARGDGIYPFTHTTYLPCLWADMKQLCDKLLRPAGTADSGLDDLALYLTYGARGIPRLFFERLQQDVRLESGGPCLCLARADLRRARFYAGLERALTRPRDPWITDLMTYDRAQLGVRYLVDRVLMFGTAQFSKSDLIERAVQLRRNIVPERLTAERLVQTTLAVLLEHEYLEEVTPRLGAVHVDDVQPPVERRFIVSPRRLAELAGGSEDGAPRDSSARETLPTMERFTLLEKLGEGGMGTVYRAHQKGNGRMVAVKLLKRQLWDSTIALKRFHREAEVLQSLGHHNIVRFESTGTDSQSPYIAMEFVDGMPLDRMLAAHGPMSAAAAIRVASTLADAIGHVHSLGFVRNDINPRNVIMRRSGEPCLIDFGIVKSELATDLTQPGLFVGTPNYCAPEGWRQQFDARSDVYALGALLYELVTGGVPFERASRSAVMLAHLNADPVPPTRIVPIPLLLESAILKCLAKQPSVRFQTMEELRLALEAVDAPAPTRVLTQFVDASKAALETIEARTIMLSPAQAAAAHAASEATRPPVTPRALRSSLAVLGDAGGVAVAPLSPARFNLKVTGGGYSGDLVPVKLGRTLIGRAETCDICLLVPDASRYHTALIHDDAGVQIEDLNSQNGTFVNGEAVRGARLLSVNDLVEVGGVELQMVFASPARP